VGFQTLLYNKKRKKDEKDFIYSMYVVRLCPVHDGTG